jgi:Carboxypeptidase regulatory-like domain
VKRQRLLAAIGMALLVFASLVVQASGSAQNGSAIRGKVVDAVSHQPLAAVRAAAFRMRGTKALATAFSTTDGSFKLDGLGSGLYRLELSKAGFRGLTIEGIAVRANEVMIIAGSIGMLPGSAAPANIAQARNQCGNLVQPGVTADVYVVCAQAR